MGQGEDRGRFCVFVPLSYSVFVKTENRPLSSAVIITNLWETLTYTVCETKIIKPYEVDEIHIKEGSDLLTLLTCHPYGSGGKYRYLVYCERVIA